MPVALTREEAECESAERLNPRLTNPSWLILRKRRELFQKWIAALPGSGLRVLDVGGRIQPYRPLLANRVASYIAIDVRATPLVDILSRAEQLPFRDAGFDLVFCTQVLQYVYEPSKVIVEMHRVLKPGGCLFLSVPGAQIQDGEEECWRFLPEALRRMLSPFARVEIQPEGGSVTGFFRTVNSCLNIFVRYPFARSVYQRTICPLINIFAASLDSVSGDNHQFAANYSVLAQK